MTIKDKLLIGIVQLGRVDNAKDLRIYAATDEHHITHVLWRMQKQGLITFHETGASVLTKIVATPKGLKARSQIGDTNGQTDQI